MISGLKGSGLMAELFAGIGGGIKRLVKGSFAGAGKLKKNIDYHVDLITLRREIERLFSELGGRTFELLSQDPHADVGSDPEVLEWLVKLQEYDARLRSRKAHHAESGREE
jgi:hypothetical protein